MTTAILLIGSYASGDAQGVYSAQLNPATGELSAPENVSSIASTTGFLALSPDGKQVYGIGRGAKDSPGAAGRIAAFACDPQTGKLKLLNEVAIQGEGPAHVCLSRGDSASDKRFVLIANYHSGSIEAYATAEDGSLGEQTAFIQHTGSSVDPDRQTEPHPHSINVSPDGRFALVADLGLDKVLVYALDPKTGELTPHDPPFAKVAPGSGPRHLAWNPAGDRVYLLNEMSSTVTVFDYDAAAGRLDELQTISTMPPGSEAHRQSAEIRVHPSGKYLYASNRGEDTIAVFAIDQANGRLEPIEIVPCGVEWPRNFEVDPTGKFLLSGGMRSNDIAVLSIDESTGKLTLTDQRVEAPAPVCLRFLP